VRRKQKTDYGCWLAQLVEQVSYIYRLKLFDAAVPGSSSSSVPLAQCPAPLHSFPVEQLSNKMQLVLNKILKKPSTVHHVVFVCFFSGSLMQRPSRRDQVSPPPVPELSHSRFDYSMYRGMMHAVPRPGHSRAVGTPQDYSHESDFSEWMNASSSTPVNFTRNPSFRPMPGPQSVFAAATLHQNSGHGFTSHYRQNSVYPGKHTVQGHNNMMFKSTQPDGAMFWPGRDGYRSQRSPLKRPQLSSSHSINNAVAKIGQQAKAELVMQQTQIVRKE